MPGRQRVTLSDVARHAGVSTTTASYILNGRSADMRISADAAARVQAAVAQLGYVPNRAARTLRTSTTATIGLISDMVAGGRYASQMLVGASEAARLSNHLLLIGETDGDADIEAKLVGEMMERRVDGIILATVATVSLSVPSSLRGGNLVLLNCLDPELDVPAILPDDLGGGRTAARVLLDAGRGHDVVVVGVDDNPVALAGPRRLEGLSAELQEQGFSVRAVIDCRWDVIPAREAVIPWLKATLAEGAAPSGFVCLNDRIAMGVYQALAEFDLSVPSDVAVVSFDGSDLAGWLQPTLTTVALPYEQLGALAVRCVLGKQQATSEESNMLLPMPLRPGASVN